MRQIFHRNSWNSDAPQYIGWLLKTTAYGRHLRVSPVWFACGFMRRSCGYGRGAQWFSRVLCNDPLRVHKSTEIGVVSAVTDMSKSYRINSDISIHPGFTIEGGFKGRIQEFSKRGPIQWDQGRKNKNCKREGNYLQIYKSIKQCLNVSIWLTISCMCYY